MSSSGALFGGSAAGPGSTGGNKHLVEMRAGKMNLKGRTVVPDTRKGLLFVYQSEDSLMHFCWQDRTSGIVEDDLIIFPDDCEYVKVPQCTTGRVFLLKFKSSNRRFFFWLQEPRIDKDEDHCKRINEYLNNPAGSVPVSGPNDPDLQSLLNNMSQSQLMQLFGGGQIGGLSSLLGTISRPSTGGSARTSTTTPSSITAQRTTPSTPSSTPATAAGVTTPVAATTTTTAAAAATPQDANGPPTVVPNAPRRTSGAAAGTAVNVTPAVAPAAAAAVGAVASEVSGTANSPIQLADLQSFLQGIAGGGGGGSGGVGNSEQSVDLSTALTGDALSSIINNTNAVEQLQNHLPATDGTAQDQLRSTLQSPQFQQAVSQFSSALESGQLAPVVSQFVANADAVSAAKQGNMQEFLKALEKNKDSSASAGESASATIKPDEKDTKNEEKKKKQDGEKEKDDEGMQLD